MVTGGSRSPGMAANTAGWGKGNRMNADILPSLGYVRAKQVLSECVQLLPADDSLATALDTVARRLDEPMRLAVVGQVNRGKSTLVNALLGAEVVTTGRQELTFNVNELHFAEAEAIVVHFRDGTPAQEVTRDTLARWTSYDPENLADLCRVRKVIFGLPNQLLRNFHLIDTPGLGSVHVADSSATLSQIGIEIDAIDPSLQAAFSDIDRRPSDIANESLAELDQADAVLYLFSRGIHQQDRMVLSELSSNHHDALTPLKAFGVLSKCDDYWPAGPEQVRSGDPLFYHPLRDGAAPVIDRYFSRPEIRQYFYVVVPVAARVAAGASELDADHLTWLGDLSRNHPVLLMRELADEASFGERTYAIPRAARRQLLALLGPWGIHLACEALRAGLSAEKVRDHLLGESGVGEVRELIIRHFGNRATLIKLSQAMRSSRLILAAHHDRGNRVVEDIGQRIELLERSEQGFAEIAALSAHYMHHLTDFSDAEINDLLEVTGERGTHCASRLGLSADASLAALAEKAVESVRYWTLRSNDPLLERNGRQVARTMLRSYEGIAHRIHLAMRFLEMVD